MDANSPVEVLIVDDGELAAARERLEELGIGYAEALCGAGFCNSRSGSLPTRLLVSSARHAIALERLRQRQDPGSRPLHVVVAEATSRTMRDLLERSSLDVVLTRPIHPAAMELLVHRAFYDGPENRRGKRVAIGVAVKMKVGSRTKAATLMQLSERGCGLRCDRTEEPRQAVSVILPRQLTGSNPLTLEGRVVGSKKAGQPKQGRVDLRVRFNPLNAAARRFLGAIMKAHGIGGAALDPAARRKEAPRPGVSRSKDAKRATRGRYVRPLLGFYGAPLSLVGSDLSKKGMRIRSEPSLGVGHELKLVLYCTASIPRILVKAVVARDDGAGGLFLRFRAISKTATANLDKLLASLPGVESKASDEPGPGVVVSEVIERQ